MFVVKTVNWYYNIINGRTNQEKGAPKLNSGDIHSGHRERLKNKFIKYGLDSFEIHEIFELLLFYVIPRKDTNPIAHALVKRFRTVDRVMDAPFSTLTQVDGIGKEAACFLKIILSFTRIYMESKSRSLNQFKTRYQLSDHLMLSFVGRAEECIAILLLNPKKEIIYEGIVNKGTYNFVDIQVRTLIELIITHSATGILLAHNHPSGMALPSKEDLAVTEKLASVLRTMNVHFIDHIIVANDDYISLKDCNIPGFSFNS